MRRLALLPLLLAACVNDTVQGVPAISVGATTDGSILVVSLSQQPDHGFAATMTVNGVAAPAPTLYPGHVPPANTSPFADQAAPAVASFNVPMSALTGPGVHIVLDDGGDHYVVDVPQLLAPRAIHSAMPTTLHTGDAITVDSGVPGDELYSVLSLTENSTVCMSAFNADNNDIVLPDYVTFWGCGTPPAAGTTLATTLSLTVTGTTPITTCDGPGVTCDARAAFANPAAVELPATLAF